jgi:hypothetical protein
MYGRDAILPIEFANKTIAAECSEENWLDDLTKRIQALTGKVIGDRLEVQDTIYQAQQVQKKRHDADLNEISFKIGDLVLLYQSQLRGKQKLQERWKGPYYVHEVLKNGAYKLRMIEGKILKIPVNAERLKQYHQR